MSWAAHLNLISRTFAASVLSGLFVCLFEVAESLSKDSGNWTRLDTNLVESFATAKELGAWKYLHKYWTIKNISLLCRLILCCHSYGHRRTTTGQYSRVSGIGESRCATLQAGRLAKHGYKTSRWLMMVGDILYYARSWGLWSSMKRESCS